MFTPNHSVARTDHIHWNIQSYYFLNFLINQLAERRQDVRIVFDGFLKQLCLIHQVIVHVFRGDVLTECVVAEKDVIAREITHHAVRPVEHRSFNEYELFRSETERVSGLYHLKIPVLMIKARKGSV